MKRWILYLAIGGCLAFAALASGCASPHEHSYGEWTRTEEPTCLREGKEVARCLICDKEIFQKVPVLSHDYSGEPIPFKEATCEEEGEIHYECQRGCGSVHIEFTEPKGHDYSGEANVILPTCTQKGERSIPCKNGCGKALVTVLTALGHTYGEVTVLKSATCEEPGKTETVCTVCGYSEEEVIPPLEHKFGDFTVDFPSTLTTDGQKSRHCLREGCDKQIDITILPKGSRVEYSVRVIRTNGKEYPFSDEIKVCLYEGEEKVGSYPLNKGEAKFEVEDKGYQVKIEGLRTGYRQKESVKLDRGCVDLKLIVEASVVENDGEKSPPKPLWIGDPMYDFLVRDIDTPAQNYQRLSELLQGKKGAYIDFFYVGCGACTTYFPTFVKQYESFGQQAEDLLVILADVNPDTPESIRKLKARYREEFLWTTGIFAQSELYSWVPCDYLGVPFGYFLDAEGVIVEIVSFDTAEAIRGLADQYHSVLSEILQDEFSTLSQWHDGKDVALGKNSKIFENISKPIVKKRGENHE